MDEDGDRNVRKKLSDEKIEQVDRLSDLPACLIFKVLLNLPTKNVVKTSVLSTRWRNLWRYVPGLDLGTNDFSKSNDDFVSFVDEFLGFDNESCLQKFKLNYKRCDHIANVMRWINTVVNRKVQHFSCLAWGEKLELPLTVYGCESLVSLELAGLTMPNPKFVSLPTLKNISMCSVKFANELDFEMLISSCPVLESLTLRCDNVIVLRVVSQSLLNFTFFVLLGNTDGIIVTIDAPRLEYLCLTDHETSSFFINNTVSLVKVDINITFNVSTTKRTKIEWDNDLLKRDMIRNFLNEISSTVKVMNISSCTLEIISGYSRYERLPVFRNLSSLTFNLSQRIWEFWPIFLESCPNLKSLCMKFWQTDYIEGIHIHGLPRSLASLKYVKIETSNEAAEMELAGYILENSIILKKFTLCLNKSRKNEEFGILKKLLSIPRLSSSCQIVVVFG